MRLLNTLISFNVILIKCARLMLLISVIPVLIDLVAVANNEFLNEKTYYSFSLVNSTSKTNISTFVDACMFICK